MLLAGAARLLADLSIPILTTQQMALQVAIGAAKSRA